MEEETPEVDQQQVPEKKRRKLTPEQEDRERKFPKGCRYDVCLAKAEDPCCYVSFHDCDTMKEAQQVCTEKAIQENRECVVWDYEVSDFVFRHKVATEVAPVEPVATDLPKPKRRAAPTKIFRK